MIVCESSLIIEEKGNTVRGKEGWSPKKKKTKTNKNRQEKYKLIN
jgi:hypothetical protein